MGEHPRALAPTEGKEGRGCGKYAQKPDVHRAFCLESLSKCSFTGLGQLGCFIVRCAKPFKLKPVETADRSARLALTTSSPYVTTFSSLSHSSVRKHSDLCPLFDFAYLVLDYGELAGSMGPLEISPAIG